MGMTRSEREVIIPGSRSGHHEMVQLPTPGANALLPSSALLAPSWTFWAFGGEPSGRVLGAFLACVSARGGPRGPPSSAEEVHQPGHGWPHGSGAGYQAAVLDPRRSDDVA